MFTARAIPLVAALFAIEAAGCTASPGTADPPPVAFGRFGPLAGDAGKGSWRFGVATSATQIEDQDTATDWYLWTRPTDQGGLGHGSFVGDATRGYTNALADLDLIQQLGVDSYRFSIEWARIEPIKDQIDMAAVQHYRDELVALRARGIHPLVTIHHFSNPVWVADPRDPACENGPTDTNLCGFGSAGGSMIGDQMAEHAALLARQLGDLVDEWGTVNEPIDYLFAAYGAGQFPPGGLALTNLPQLSNVVRDYIAAHAKIYNAIKANDTIDADGDGVAASVGFTILTADWVPARNHALSDNPDDIAARDRLAYLFHELFVRAAVDGSFDADFDGTADEQHPEWAHTVDWLGVQYYFRAGVTGSAALLPAPISLTPCYGGLDLGACVPATDPSYCIPQMSYEGWIDGFHDVLRDIAIRFPGLPLVVTEAGIATDTGTRRAENLVRVLEAVARARDEGVDVRGYYHWSLTDNFEWAMGFAPHFGLYRVDYSTYARTPTEGATVYSDIAHARQLTGAQRKQYGGTGPMTAEAGAASSKFCQ